MDNEKDYPIFFNHKDECCGCTACYAICPTKAISMVEDNEGFLYPSLDHNKCIKCHACLKVCSFKIRLS